MQQVGQYVGGERDYIKLYGDTGPLVYPAAHVYIYRALYAITDQGQDIKLAQYIFIGLYLATLLLVMQCYRAAKVPPYIFPLLILSKRLHSVFLLRLFNDCFAVFFLFLAIYCYQRRLWSVGSFVYSIGLGVKMSLLLALPAIGVVLWQAIGRNRALRQAMFIGQVQVSRVKTASYAVTNVLADITCVSVLAQESLGIPFKSVRIQPPVPFQVDRKLAIHGRGALLVKRVLVRLASWTYLACCRIYLNKVGSPAFRGHPRAARLAAAGSRAGQTCTEDESELHPHRHPHIRPDWMPVRAQFALPVLCIRCLDHTLPALAQWHASDSDICHLGCSRMGMECVSQYGYQLDPGHHLHQARGPEYLDGDCET